MSTEAKPVIAAEPAVAQAPAVVPAEEVKDAGVPAVMPETVPAIETAVVAKDEEAKQPTTTHAEQGNLHVANEVATQVDGTPAPAPKADEEAPAADVPATETTAPKAEEKKEEKKVATKEKAEKTKSEAKGFFAKLFGPKSPKKEKEKKVKTPKTEKADPIASAPAADAAATTEPAAEAHVDATEPKAEVTGVALAAEPVPTPAVEEVPVASTSAAPVAAPVAAETEAVKDVETTPAAATETPAETKPDEPVVERDMKAIKASRRISTRITSFVKNIGKKDDKPSSEKDKAKDVDAAHGEPAAAAPASVVADEAPKIEEPTPAEPINISEKEAVVEHKHQAPTLAPPVAPTVAVA